MAKKVGFSERDPLENRYDDYGYGTEEILQPLNDDGDDDDDGSTQAFYSLKSESFSSDRDRNEAMAAERLSMRLLSIPDDDEEEQDRILRESLALITYTPAEIQEQQRKSIRAEKSAGGKFYTMLILLCVGMICLLGGIYYISTKIIGPPSQPLGPYQLVERQEGSDFFNYYTFYEGRDSMGSNGYLMYVNEEKARNLGIVNVTYEEDVLDLYAEKEKAKTEQHFYTKSKYYASGEDDDDDDDNNNNIDTTTTTTTTNSSSSSSSSESKSSKVDDSSSSSSSSSSLLAAIEGIPLQSPINEISKKKEPFIYMGSSPTEAGPRDSIRLEGKRRFNRGLFIIDVRHMPAGCGVWPAFWLTDEANWPVNGEIDIVEGVNYQSNAKTALHSTKGCVMDDIPAGVMTGSWDPAVGIPDKKTGIPDMTMRYAQNCFVYDPHQWLNQGCVAVDRRNDTLGIPLNKQGGGVFALEWDPNYRHMRTWAFTPHKKVPDNLRDAIRTANLSPAQRIMPDPDLWPIPYGYFAIGEGTNCPANHFRNMRLVFNLAFCGSVSGNRFQLDCPAQAKQFDTCNEYVASRPKELDEAYWKIRGVFVYERSWERTWMN